MIAPALATDRPTFIGPRCAQCGEIGIHGSVDECLLSMRAAIHDLRAQLPVLLSVADPDARVHEQIRHYRGIPPLD